MGRNFPADTPQHIADKKELLAKSARRKKRASPKLKKLRKKGRLL